jgi:hypothetical protein
VSGMVDANPFRCWLQVLCAAALLSGQPPHHAHQWLLAPITQHGSPALHSLDLVSKGLIWRVAFLCDHQPHLTHAYVCAYVHRHVAAYLAARTMCGFTALHCAAAAARATPQTSAVAATSHRGATAGRTGASVSSGAEPEVGAAVMAALLSLGRPPLSLLAAGTHTVSVEGDGLPPACPPGTTALHVAAALGRRRAAAALVAYQVGEGDGWRGRAWWPCLILQYCSDALCDVIAVCSHHDATRSLPVYLICYLGRSMLRSVSDCMFDAGRGEGTQVNGLSRRPSVGVLRRPRIQGRPRPCPLGARPGGTAALARTGREVATKSALVPPHASWGRYSTTAIAQVTHNH